MPTVSPIVVEDGTGVANANSYASVEQLQQYAADHGYTLPIIDNDVVVLLYKAMQYIELRENVFIGYRASPVQALSWPRKLAYGATAVYLPPVVVNAQLQLACEASAGVSLMPTVLPNGNLKKKVRGPLTDEYFAPNQAGTGAPQFPVVNALLAVVSIGNAGAIGALKLVRA